MRYGRRIELSPINSIRGSLHIDLGRNATLHIGKFLMSRGPMYIKCTDNAKVIIGDSVFFNNNCSITAADEIFIGNHCMIANNVVIVDHDHRVLNREIVEELVSNPVRIEDNVWIGANATILRGAIIGESSVVAAGGVVNSKVAAHTIVGGIPSRKIKNLE